MVLMNIIKLRVYRSEFIQFVHQKKYYLKNALNLIINKG